jgi:3-oxocholest-4-en-26-oyl-CoA dehydrogenase beta subunit
VDFSFTQSQGELSALCRKILTDKVTPQRLAEIEQAGDRFDPILWATLAESGVLAAALPEAAGGAGLGLAEQCAVLIELGRALAPAPYLESVVLGAGLLAEFGSPAQVARWAVPTGAGEMIITAALAEPGTDDPAGPSVRAEPDAGGWRLSGTKTAVPAGVAAGMFLVTARHAAGDQADAGADLAAGAAVYAVERTDPGVTVQPQRLTGGQGPAELELDAVRLDHDRLVGPADGGAAVRWLVDRATLGLCAHQLGVAERALELTAAYARNREQFGRPIGGFQAVAHRLADAYVDVAGIRLTMWQAAWRLQAGLPCAAEIATAKFWAADAGHRVAHTAVHVHGGVGVDASHLLHRYFTAAKENEFALGGATAQLRRLGALLASTA